MNNQTQIPVRNFNIETIPIKIKKIDAFFIGETISKYPVDGIAKFLKIINNCAGNAQNLNDIITIEPTVELVLDIVEKLGEEKEFYYTYFNAQLEILLSNSIGELEDADLQEFIINRLLARKALIELNKTTLIQKYIDKWF